MPITLTDQILRFSKAIDIMDTETYLACLEVIQKYFEAIDVIYYAALIDGVRVNRLPGLEQIWGSDNSSSHYTIYDPENTDNYYGQAAYCYDLGRPVWISTGSTENPLKNHQGRYHDQWNDEEIDVPFVDMAGGNASTTVYLPLRLGTRVFGVLNMDFDRSLELTKSRRMELTELAEAMSTIIWLRETTEQNIKNTQEAFSRFSSHFQLQNSSLGDSKVFLASPKNAEPSVVKAITDVLKEFPSLKIIDWKELNAPGLITDQIEEEIRSARFGICYLSEYDSKAAGRGDHPFRDNANVLFEAGMFHSADHEFSDVPGMWIAVRESEKFTTDAPFDIANLRMVVVPRKQDGTVDHQEFQDQLSKMVRWIIENH